MVMSEKAKQELRNTPRKRCSICNSPTSSGNPIKRCYECKKLFCYDHIYGGQINDQMAENDPIRNICEKCRLELGYRRL